MLQLHLAVGKPLDIQKSLDHTRQAFGFLVDHVRHLLALFLAEVIAAHQLTGALDGGERSAHLVRDEMDGLLVALSFSLRRAQRPPHHEVLVAGGGGNSQPSGRHGREVGKHDALPEHEERCEMRGYQQRSGRQVGRPAVEQDENQARQHAGQQAEADHRQVRRIDQELAAFQGLEKLCVNLDAGNPAFPIGSRYAIVGCGIRRHAHENCLTGEASGQIGVIVELLYRNLRNEVWVWGIENP